MPKKPDDMSDEMWAAVCIVMEDRQISSYNKMSESHQAMIERMDHLETTWSEKQANTDPVTQGDGGAGGTGSQQGSDSGSTGEKTGDATGGTAPPLVEKDGDGDGEKKGSGRGGKLRWYERDGYAK